MPKEKPKADGPQLFAGRWVPLSDEAVLEIRESSETTVALAARFKRSPATIARIRCGEVYPDVGGPIRAPIKPSLRSARIDRATAAAIRMERGLSVKQIAAKRGLSERTVRRIVNWETWTGPNCLAHSE